MERNSDSGSVGKTASKLGYSDSGVRVKDQGIKSVALQVQRGLLCGCIVLGGIFFLAGLASFPENIILVAVSCLLMASGFIGFRWISKRYSEVLGKKSRPSSVVRVVGLFVAIAGCFVLFRSVFSFFMTLLVFIQGSTALEDWLIILRQLAIGVIPGLLLVWVGVWLRKTNKE